MTNWDKGDVVRVTTRSSNYSGLQAEILATHPDEGFSGAYTVHPLETPAYVTLWFMQEELELVHKFQGPQGPGEPHED